MSILVPNLSKESTDHNGSNLEKIKTNRIRNSRFVKVTEIISICRISVKPLGIPFYDILNFSMSGKNFKVY